ncbi:lipoyl(octanoyl) transferase LipB [Glycomyces algeriensis]|uniref:Octanoyltransferase n=1 Tax=Glycomyces algeriensis TaxID=256037 RepID=A0A9W6LGE7_9ACTN|nr:lipoyl(octanoyl) transferase LipB [Glycomyces algeriensis]MDA1365111.1 lipoyl(octanoyl) transferase LipB [Glycomyces algeriensis]MDR7349827.1 lipoyl(octanoyl) transferase [Glycomyces algeriensis]GLI42538.1 octanoyltransferase [Glycomyces algeriensis]
MTATVGTASVAGGKITVERRGLVDYQEAWDYQKALQQRRIDDEIGDTVLLLEHPSVYTAGRRTETWALPQDGTPVVTVDRGGQITWHGPGQIVGYPIMKMRNKVDVVGYVRRVEDTIAAVCHEFGVTSARGRMHDRTGVWLPEDDKGPERKICAIGVRVRWATTMHGFALNCNPDMSYWERIAPCAITDADVTSLSQELGREVTVAEVLPVVEKHLGLLLEQD